jgi:hypothetical protein
MENAVIDALLSTVVATFPGQVVVTQDGTEIINTSNPTERSKGVWCESVRSGDNGLIVRWAWRISA